MMRDNREFDFEEFKKEAIKEMYGGKSMNGEKEIFAPLLKLFLESALEGELESHLQSEKASGLSNRRNGKTSKREFPTFHHLNNNNLSFDTVNFTLDFSASTQNIQHSY